MGADIAWGQIQGHRPSQQDSAACLSWPSDLHLLILADGLGGHAGGEVASATAVKSFRDAFVAAPAGMAIGQRLLAGLQAANLAIYDHAQASPELRGMGTTLVAAGLEQGSLIWVSVGDSALWLLRDHALRRLNENHSVGGMLDNQIEAGEINAEDAASAPDRSDLLEALMGDDVSLVDAPRQPVRLQPGDIVILASDGVKVCDDAELIDITTGIKRSSGHLVDAILESVERHARPGQDNATAIVVQVDSPGENG
ncbi:MAG: protein phosphatase 2C domain-containing protein [Bryobacterales bacterium]|nr:protein phosphatase 2C domain-containing protein [Bryobacterales bacterium]